MAQFGPLTIGDAFDFDDEVRVADAEGDHVLGYATRAQIEDLHGHLTTLLGHDVADEDDVTEEGDYFEAVLDPGRVQALTMATTLVGGLTSRTRAVDEVLMAADWLLDEEPGDYEVESLHPDDEPPTVVLPEGVVPLFPPPFRPHEA